jgi:hypothetical protein
MKTLTALLLLAAAGPLAAQAGWRMVPTTDALTGTADRRLVLRADTTPTPGDTTLSHRDRLDAIAVVCGERLPGAAGRSLLLYTTEPWQEFGPTQGYADLRFDGRPEAVHAYLTLLDYGVITPTGRVAPRHVAFLGSEASPYFSSPILARLLAARVLTVTYRAVGAEHTLTFHVAGLPDALGQLSACRWRE